MPHLSDVVSILAIALILVVLRSLRREHIRVEHSVSWLAAATAVLLLARLPGLLTRLSAWLGLADSATSLLALILLLFVGVFYRYSRIVSSLKDMNVTLTQRVAILEFELQRRHETHQEKL